VKSNSFAKLKTPFCEFMGDIPWAVYPRPQMKRDSFFCLNGMWDFEAQKEDKIPKIFGRKILVPFAPESALSGIDEVFEEGSYLFYKREFSLPRGFIKDRVLLHFGAVDQLCEVYLNGQKVGEHCGGYDAFCFDITSALCQQNTLVVKAWDNLQDHILPYGKQRRNRGGMWYTPISGIWQTVWIESVPNEYISDIKIVPSSDRVKISLYGVKSAVICIKTENGEIKGTACPSAEIAIPQPKMWSPENPYLYEFTAAAGEDKISSYFALRTLEIKKVEGKARILLNGKPYFFHGLLDQGYFSDGIYTPAAPEAFANDILEMKRLGFNTLRKHIKVEPEQFYYDCDRLGMIVFQDMVNNGHYSFFRDTALPTINLKRLSDKNLHKNKKSREQFVLGMKKTVKQLYNHPSICYWTMFNEGWGQFCSDEMYSLFKTLDNTRIIDTASGWFKGGESDVESEHIYFKPFKFKPAQKPTVLSEFGGYSYRPEGHIFNLKKAYGYRFFENRDEFEAALISLYENEIIPAAKSGLSGAIYTQVSDVEDETNGLLSYDRRVCKVGGEKMRAIAKQLNDAIE